MDEQQRLDTGGRFMGWVGVVGAGALVVLYLLQLREPDPYPLWLLTGSLFAGSLLWAAILRPRVLVTPEVLVLRNMLHTVRLPLAAVEGIVLRQVLVVRAGGRRHVATGVGRSLRATARGRGGVAAAASSVASRPRQVVDAADFVEERLTHLASEARERARVRRGSPEQLALAGGVRREPAWPVVALLGVTLVLFVLSLLL